MQDITGKPMLASQIDELLAKTDITLDDVTWHKLDDCVDHTVAEYEGIIRNQKVFLHLMSYERTNYWIITYPNKPDERSGQCMVLYDYDLSDITNLATSLIDAAKNDNSNPKLSV